MITIIARYNEILKDKSPYESLADTVRFLHALEEDGECFALGIYDPESKIMHIPENMDVSSLGRDVVLGQKMEEFRKQGFEIDKIEFYDQGI